MKLQVGDVVELESGDIVVITSWNKEGGWYFSTQQCWNESGVNGHNNVVRILSRSTVGSGL